MKKIWIILLIAIVACPAFAAETKSTKAERNTVRRGVELYDKGNYHEALREFEKALQINPQSQYALYDKALALVNLASDDNKDKPNDPRKKAAELFRQVAETNTNPQLAEYSWYNLGNMAYNDKDYAQAIKYYKASLRINPDNRKARQNLLLALKQQENPDQDQQQQQQQDQQEQQQQQQEQQPEPQPQEMSQDAEQILQSMQNKENQTRQKQQRQERGTGRPSTLKPW